MPPESERVTVRLPEDQIKKLDKLIKKGEYGNLSDVIREAIQELLDRKYTPENLERRTINFPKDSISNLEKLVNDGDAIDIEDAVRNAVRDYIRGRVRRPPGGSDS
jgi:Arc/MetJ-type ribon-helix-helix transcriptional regulator